MNCSLIVVAVPIQSKNKQAIFSAIGKSCQIVNACRFIQQDEIRKTIAIYCCEMAAEKFICIVFTNKKRLFNIVFYFNKQTTQAVGHLLIIQPQLNTFQCIFINGSIVDDKIKFSIRNKVDIRLSQRKQAIVNIKSVLRFARKQRSTQIRFVLLLVFCLPVIRREIFLLGFYCVLPCKAIINSFSAFNKFSVFRKSKVCNQTLNFIASIFFNRHIKTTPFFVKNSSFLPNLSTNYAFRLLTADKNSFLSRSFNCARLILC